MDVPHIARNGYLPWKANGKHFSKKWACIAMTTILFLLGFYWKFVEVLLYQVPTIDVLYLLYEMNCRLGGVINKLGDMLWNS